MTLPAALPAFTSNSRGAQADLSNEITASFAREEVAELPPPPAANKRENRTGGANARGESARINYLLQRGHEFDSLSLSLSVRLPVVPLERGKAAVVSSTTLGLVVFSRTVGGLFDRERLRERSGRPRLARESKRLLVK